MLEIGAPDPLLELLAVAALDLVRQQSKEKFLVWKAVLARLLEPQLERLQDAAQPKLLQ